MNKLSRMDVVCFASSTTIVLAGVVFGGSNMEPQGAAILFAMLCVSTCLTVRAVKWHQRQAGLYR